MQVEVQLPPKLIPVFLGEARYRGAYGGRGSAKTRSFAKMAAITAHRAAQAGRSGIILCVREYMNSLADSSMAEIKAAIRSEEWLVPFFDIGETYIRTIDGRVEFVFTGLRHNLDSIKSKAQIILCWADEAEPIVDDAWEKLIPTVREDASEIWVTWNPEIEGSATDKRFRDNPAADVKIVELNYRDNPWFPTVLERERLEDKRLRPHSYDHVWGGAYKTHFEGAYFTEQLTLAKEEGRISVVPEDPHMIIRLFADIGGTGAKADNFVFWAAQFVGMTINCVNHYEVQGQPIAAHLSWMRSQGYTPDRCKIWLPHDGDTQDKVFDTSYRKAFEEAGYSVVVVPNQGKGAAMQRVEKSRELFPRVWIDENKCAAGLKAIRAYHEKRDPKRKIGLGPNHDENSHSADAYGLMNIAYEPPRGTPVALDYSRIRRGIA
jgi:phage terminase large subunit